MAEYRQDEVNKVVASFAKVLSESDLGRSEGLNAVVQFVLEVATHDADQADACARCIAVAMVECLFAQSSLRHRPSALRHLNDPEIIDVKEPKKEGAN